jgi:hypothetical protein
MTGPRVELELVVKYDRERSWIIKHPNDPRGRALPLPKSVANLLREASRPSEASLFDVAEWFAVKEGLV